MCDVCEHPEHFCVKEERYGGAPQEDESSETNIHEPDQLEQLRSTFLGENAMKPLSSFASAQRSLCTNMKELHTPAVHQGELGLAPHAFRRFGVWYPFHSWTSLVIISRCTTVLFSLPLFFSFHLDIFQMLCCDSTRHF